MENYFTTVSGAVSSGLGAGLSSLAFWGFIAIVVVAGIWSSVRAKEIKQRSIDNLIEKGDALDPETLKRLLRQEGSSSRDLKVSAMIMLFIAPGLLGIGWVLSDEASIMMNLMAAVAGLLVFLAIGMYLAAKIVERDE